MRTINARAKGIGLRNEHLAALIQHPQNSGVDFLELAPENWMNMGGVKREYLERIADHYPLVAHGLSLSIGDTEPLNIDLIKQVRDFLERYKIAIYSEHLSFSRDQQGYLYDLLPVPRHVENINYFANRIKQVQDMIGRPLVLENISYYHHYPDELPEALFLSLLVEKSQCELLLDINNLYVNSHNHHYDPDEVIHALPSQAIRYYHIAGHLKQEDNFLLDTHGKPVSEPVLQLAQRIIAYHGMRPLLLERDHYIPPLASLCDELTLLHKSMGTHEVCE